MAGKEKKQRILLVSPMPPAIGGISLSSARLCNRLLADGYTVETYNLQIPKPRLLQPIWQLLNMLWLPIFVLLRPRYDIIHFHVSGNWRRVFLKLTTPFYSSSKTVVTVHGDVGYYLRHRLGDGVMNFGDRIICVRPGDRMKLPEKLQSKTVEIPAFIMPPRTEIEKIDLPAQVSGIIDDAAAKGLPLLVFNGAVVLDYPHPDLYGFREFADLLLSLHAKDIRVAAMIIVNDLHLGSAKSEFVAEISEKLKDLPDVHIFTGLRFSLLKVFAHPDVVYVRPTKTDGDSLSVREAMAMGVPTVVSDAAERPEGAIVYDRTDSSALLDAVLQGISCVGNIRDNSNRVDFDDFYKDIVGVYNSLNNGCG